MSRLSAAMYDWAMARADTRRLGKWRRELLTELAGDVVEIGAGTGVNLLHYGEGVQRLVLFEPNRSMRRRAEGRVERSGRPHTEVLDGSAEALAVEDASVDVVVSTLVLCSVSDQAVALAEVWRAGRPAHLLRARRRPRGLYGAAVATTDRPCMAPSRLELPHHPPDIHSDRRRGVRVRARSKRVAGYLSPLDSARGAGSRDQTLRIAVDRDRYETEWLNDSMLPSLDTASGAVKCAQET